MVIDCDECVMNGTPACDDCMVTVRVGRSSGEAVVIDAAEARELRLLQREGLGPRLRLITKSA